MSTVWTIQTGKVFPDNSMDNPGLVKDPTDAYYENGKSERIGNGTAIDPDKIISVIGSGDYGRAISGRLVKSGYTVFIGSRDPSRNSIKSLVRQTGANLVNQETAIVSSNVIIVAVGRDYYDRLPLSSLRDKILIDVSNNTEQRKGPHYKSNAEYLQALIPEANVVKGFNVVSAYSLENGGLQGSKEVYIASDHNESKTTVSNLVRAMGFTPVDWGTLRASRDIEDIPLRLMPSWRRPTAVVFGLFLFLYTVALMSFQICPNAASGNWHENWEHLALVNLNRSLGICALWTLSFCYLPGILAGYIQLYRGTKYSRFPNWMDNWLKMRKQLGLLMFAMACVHGCISLAYINPEGGSWVYEKPQKIVTTVIGENGTRQEATVSIHNFNLNWRGELFLTLGAIALCLTAVLGISSLPSVTATLTWREFTFIQSKLGWVTLLIASAHDVFLAWHYMFLYFGCFNTIPIGPQYALYAPFLCVLLKIPLLLPPVDKYLQKIRKGYERNSDKGSDKPVSA